MKIPVRININDEKIKELARSEIRKAQFIELEEIKNRLLKLEERDLVYRRYLKEKTK